MRHACCKPYTCSLTRSTPLSTTGHHEAAATASLEAQAAEVAGAVLERAKLLWHSGRERRALAELQAAQRRCGSGLVWRTFVSQCCLVQSQWREGWCLSDPSTWPPLSLPMQASILTFPPSPCNSGVLRWQALAKEVVQLPGGQRFECARVALQLAKWNAAQVGAGFGGLCIRGLDLP